MELSFVLTALIFTLIGILLGILIREGLEMFYEWQEDRMWSKFHQPVVLADWERELLQDDICSYCTDGYHIINANSERCICCQDCG